MLQLVDSGSIPAFYLRGLACGVGERQLTLEELTLVLRRLSPKCPRENGKASEAALEVLAQHTHSLTDAQYRHMLASRELRELMLRILKATVDKPGHLSHAWFAVAKVFWRTGDHEVLSLAVQALVSQDYQFRERAESFLADCAASRPGAVMAALEQVMMDNRHQYHFSIDKYVNLVSALPVAVIAQWLDKVGVKGARRLARHLPQPYIDPEGQPQVPEVTAYVLQKFEDDKRTFREFCAGVSTTDWYSVEGGKKREHDALVAEQFLHHPLHRIREWARAESTSARAQAERQRIEEEEKIVS
jgi:hypothetical protein